MTLRYCLPRVRGRGAGLGNELIPWARSLLAARVLGARALLPAFGLNRRRYGRHFGTPRSDWLLHRGLQAALPRVEFGEAEHLRFGGGEVTESFREFARAQRLFDRRAYVVVTEGMWGGYAHIAPARDAVRALLLGSRFAARNLAQLRARLDPARPTVGLHVRLGDFAPSGEASRYAGRFNVALPLAWYRDVAHSIARQLDDRVQFLVVSDAPAQQLAPLTDELPCVSTTDQQDADCSDLLALSQADLLVCAVSSFSTWAAFLSDAPYLWYRPQLHVHAEGFASIWGHEATQAAAGSPTREAIATWRAGASLRPRGWPVDADGVVPPQALERIGVRHALGEPEADLVRYGVVPIAAVHA